MGLMSAYVLANVMSNSTPLFNNDIECLAGCEITDNHNNIVFQCVGEEGTCSKTALGHTLTCSGQEKKKE